MAAMSRSREFAVDIVRRLRSAGHTALFAGGCVRDLLLGREPKDFDVATTARPEAVRDLFGHRRTLAVGASFGVIVVIGSHDAGHVEVATFRTEGNYLDGRRPQSVEFCSPEEDAKRRDFTINGMFFDPIDEQVFDYVGGQQDLAQKVIRAIGNPHDRMEEDKLRMLRAVRFAATLNFALDPVTADAVGRMASDLVVVSAERIAQELKKMLVDRHRRRAVELAETVGLLAIVLPELNLLKPRVEWTSTLGSLELLHHPSFELALAALLKPLPPLPMVHDICRRLKLSNVETENTVWLIAHQSDLDQASNLSLAKLKRCLAEPLHEELLKLMEADRRATLSTLEPVEFCRKFLAATPREVINPPPLITGDDLIRLGMRPGPQFKSILETIRDGQLNLQIADRDAALQMASGLIQNE